MVLLLRIHILLFTKYNLFLELIPGSTSGKLKYLHSGTKLDFSDFESNLQSKENETKIVNMLNPKPFQAIPSLNFTDGNNSVLNTPKIKAVFKQPMSGISKFFFF